MSADRNDFRLLEFIYNEEKRKCVCVFVCVCVVIRDGGRNEKPTFYKGEIWREWGVGRVGTIAGIKAEFSNMLRSHTARGSWSSGLLQGQRHESRQNGKILAKICSISVNNLLDSATQLGTRITRKGEIQCASWRWNILENIIHVKQVVGQFFIFNFPCIAESVSIIIQQDWTTYSLFISANCSTYFEWYLHPSSGAHITVSTVSDINETVTATCRERDRMGTAIPIRSRWRWSLTQAVGPFYKVVLFGQFLHGNHT